MIGTRRGYTVLPKPEIAPLTRSFGGGVIPQRPTISIAPRPTIAIPSRPTLTQPRPMPTPRPTLTPTTRRLTRPSGAIIGGLTPTVRAAMPPRADISPGALPTGGMFGGLFGGIESELRSTGSGIINTVKGLIPTATKIVAAIVILKMVFWLLKRRR